MTLWNVQLVSSWHEAERFENQSSFEIRVESEARSQKMYKRVIWLDIAHKSIVAETFFAF